jgi:hypothetical protein
MADNVAITAGSGTTIAADDIGAGVLVQRVKSTWGPDGTANDTDVASGKPMPVQLRSDVGTAVVVVEDAAAPGDPVGPLVMAVRRDTLTSSEVSAENDVIAVKADSSGRLHVYAKIDTTQVAGPAVSASATFTPAASSHVAGDCNGAAAEFALSAPSAGRIMITSASLEIDGGTAEATAWRLHLFNVTPPSAVADDSPHTLPSGDRASYLGYVDLGTAADAGDTQWIETHGINKQIKLAGTSVFGYLTNLTTLTPANVAHIVTLHAVPL